MTAIPAKMKLAGYKTHLVGKWDAGMATPTHTPKGRGYDTSLNYFDHGNWGWTKKQWEGSEKNHSVPHPGRFYDLWDTTTPKYERNESTYEEIIFRDRILNIIRNHPSDDPLFLVYTPKIGHYPLQAPKSYQDKFAFIDQINRRVYHAMVNFLDDNLRAIVGELRSNGMWNDTLMVLSTDNGGYVKSPDGPCAINPADGGYQCFNGEAGANNYPLRGGKYSFFEGGVRGNAFISGGFVPKNMRGQTINEVMHIADWYSTFCGLAGVDPEDTEAKKWNMPPIDSKNMWPLISGANLTSPRKEILLTELGLISNQWKLLKMGHTKEATWTGPKYPNKTQSYVEGHEINCSHGCLFDLVNDPTEHHDVSSYFGDVVKMLDDRRKDLAETIWYEKILPGDPKCQEAAMNRYNGFLGPWLELQH